MLILKLLSQTRLGSVLTPNRYYCCNGRTLPDEATETITSSETWPNNDDTIATTAAIDDRIDTAITNDIAGSDGVSITNDGDGTITVGLPNSVDFDRIKNDDIITYG